MIGSPLKFLQAREPEYEMAATPLEMRLAYDPAAFDGNGPSDALRGQFPEAKFMPAAGAGGANAADLQIAYADTRDAGSIDRACAAAAKRAGRVIVVLANADVETTRRMMREGAADVLTAPVSDTAMVVALERNLSRAQAPTQTAAPAERTTRIVSFLKAGGGVGATSMAVQVAALLSKRDRSLKVCVVDLDVQFGQAALYLDVNNTITMTQVLSAGANLAELPFASALSPHSSGVRVLAAPTDFVPLEAISPGAIDALLTALKREFDVVLLDLPGAWTSWTYRVLRQSQQIVLVTQLSVPHAHLAKRQLDLLETQRLGDLPVTLVCNRCGGDAPMSVSVRAAEAAIGRRFDIIAPEDRKLMNAAINQGIALSDVRRGTKVEKALGELAERIIPTQADQKKRRG